MSTVRDYFEPAVPTWTLEYICAELGIDPELDIDTLRRRLLWGERVEQCEVRGDYVQCHPRHPVHLGHLTEHADVLHDWLTRPESTERPVSVDLPGGNPPTGTSTPDDSQETT